MSTRGSKPDEIDRRVAARIRERRLALNIDARLLDVAIGETPGTVERIENVGRRVGAAQLFRLARVLKTDVAYFFSEGEAAGPPAAFVEATGYETDAERYGWSFSDLPTTGVDQSLYGSVVAEYVNETTPVSPASPVRV